MDGMIIKGVYWHYSLGSLENMALNWYAIGNKIQFMEYNENMLKHKRHNIHESWNYNIIFQIRESYFNVKSPFFLRDCLYFDLSYTSVERKPRNYRFLLVRHKLLYK